MRKPLHTEIRQYRRFAMLATLADEPEASIVVDEAGAARPRQRDMPDLAPVFATARKRTITTLGTPSTYE